MRRGNGAIASLLRAPPTTAAGKGNLRTRLALIATAAASASAIHLLLLPRGASSLSSAVPPSPYSRRGGGAGAATATAAGSRRPPSSSFDDDDDVDPIVRPPNNNKRGKFDYDLVVIGAGAAGLMAAGTSAGLGRRTLLVDRVAAQGGEAAGGGPSSSSSSRPQAPPPPFLPESAFHFHLGGDCTNAACVPSKALRSAARVASSTSAAGMGRNKIGGGGGDGDGGSNGDDDDDDRDDGEDVIRAAFRHVTETVARVRSREDPGRILPSLPALDLSFVAVASGARAGGCSFISAHELRLGGCYSFIRDREMSTDDGGDNNSTVSGGTEAAGEDGGGEGKGPSSAKPSPPKPRIRIQIRREIERRVTSKKFLIATGADPIVPHALAEAAGRVGLPLLTYRTLLRPGNGGGTRISEGGDVLLRNIGAAVGVGSTPTRVVVAGGGAAACELSQSLARLGAGGGAGAGGVAVGPTLDVTVVAPSILPSEDVPARRAARTVLRGDGVTLRLHRRVVDVTAAPDASARHVAEVVLDDGTTLPADVLLVAVGCSPLPSLQTLNLQNANVAYTAPGVSVDPKTLRSTTAPNIYAAGDCCDAVRDEDRRASHAAWTAFHAVRRAFLPGVLCPPMSTHPHVPRVTFTDPEVASVGLSRADCVLRYGAGGFQYLLANEEGTDRADADRLERARPSSSTAAGPAPGYVELRVRRGDGLILGASACGPAAAEIVNEVALALTARLSCRDVAKTIHAYPSHGYLLQRVALALATGNVWGLLSTCGVLGGLVSFVGSNVERVAARCRRPRGAVREWQAEGASREFGFGEVGWEEGGGYETTTAGRKSAAVGLSFLEAAGNEDLVEMARRRGNGTDVVDDSFGDFLRWLDSRPRSRWQILRRTKRRGKS